MRRAQRVPALAIEGKRLLSLRRGWVRAKRLSRHTLQGLGTTWIAILVLRVFLDDYPWYEGVQRWIVAAMVIVSLIYGARKSRPIRAVSCREMTTDLRIEIKIGDIFEERGVLIVGTNTTFDTRMDDGTISPRSIQGQYTTQCFPAGIQDLDRQLDEALQALTPVETRTAVEKPFGKRSVYPLGTVVPIHSGQRKAYFYAMAHLSATRRAHVRMTEFSDALPRLWIGIRDQAGVDDLLCPLLAAKYGRVPAKRFELLRIIVRSFIAANRDDKVADNLTVVITPEDMEQGQIDMEYVRQWLEYECSTSTRP